MPRKSTAIKVRVEPLEKHALRQLAENERLELSDIVRRALKEFLDRHAGRKVTYGSA